MSAEHDQILGWLGADRPAIVAHRGLHADLPENSLAAITAAWQAGFTWAECDVRSTADGVPVLLHDSTLARTTTGRGDLLARRWDKAAHLRLLDASRRPTSHRLPALEEMLGAMPADAGLLVEIKTTADERFVRRIVDLTAGRRIILISFSQRNLQQAADVGAEALGQLIYRPEDIQPALESRWPLLLAEQDLIDGKLAQSLALANRLWGAWTVNDPARAARIMHLNPHLIISDRPRDVQNLR